MKIIVVNLLSLASAFMQKSKKSNHQIVLIKSNPKEDEALRLR